MLKLLASKNYSFFDVVGISLGANLLKQGLYLWAVGLLVLGAIISATLDRALSKADNA